MVNKTLNENTSPAPPQSVDLYSKNKTPRGIAEKVYPSPLYPSLPAKKLVRNLSLFFVSSFCTIFSRKLQFRFSLCYLSISKINSTLNVAGTACTDRWSLRGSQLKISYRISENPQSIAPDPLAVTAGYEWQKAVLRIFSFKGTRGFFTRSSCGFSNLFQKISFVIKC